MKKFIQSKIERVTEKLKQFITKCFVTTFTSSLLVTLSCLLYILFYNFVIPPISLTAPLNFIFNDCGSKRCDYPTAFIDFKSPQYQFPFKRGEHYRFVLDLHVPESPSNHEVGMFVSSIEFIGEIRKFDQNPKNVIFKREKKSSMLRYKSPLIHTLSSIIYSPFLVYGLTEESQRISSEVVSLYEEKPEYSLSAINIVIESKRLNIYSAHLTVQTKLEGVRSLMYHYPVISFILGVPVFLVPVIAAFLSVSSNKFEKKRKIFAAMISRGLEDNLGVSASKVEDEIPISEVEEEEKVVKEIDVPKEKEIMGGESEGSSADDESMEIIESLTATSGKKLSSNDTTEEESEGNSVETLVIGQKS